MKKVDVFAIKGKTEEDNKVILATSKKRIEMVIDDYGRIYNEGGQYIADGEVVESGFGIGCGHGGSRPGAGRPSTGRKRAYFYVTDEEKEKIKEFIKEIRK
jgi:hypothetical protein